MAKGFNALKTFKDVFIPVPPVRAIGTAEKSIDFSESEAVGSIFVVIIERNQLFS